MVLYSKHILLFGFPHQADTLFLVLHGRADYLTPYILTGDGDYKPGGNFLCRVGDFKLIWGFEGTNDGWGENCTYIWRYRPNLEQLGLDADSLLKTEDVFIGSLAKWQAEVWVKLLSQRRFDPADLSSGMTHFYNVIGRCRAIPVINTIKCKTH